VGSWVGPIVSSLQEATSPLEKGTVMCAQRLRCPPLKQSSLSTDMKELASGQQMDTTGTRLSLTPNQAPKRERACDKQVLLC
jgi:hypothetical protein